MFSFFSSKTISVNRFSKILIPGLLVLSAGVLISLFLSIDSLDSSGRYTYKIINSYPHDREAFTQGLAYDNGFLYEGTGREGYSELRKVNPATGEVLRRHKLSDEYFGEGITVFQDRVIQLTYLSNIGFVYEKETFKLLREFRYATAGWGLTTDGEHLIMSDGTQKLYFLDADTYEQVRHIEVTDRGVSVWKLNELEYVKGQVYANVWPSERIAIISPETGRVVGWVDMRGLLSSQDYNAQVDVLNGIAYDQDKDRLFVTGKFWPKLFEVKIVRARK
jgi:glutamine cyclotransferase